MRMGCRAQWIARMKRAIRTLGWRFSAARMIVDYVTQGLCAGGRRNEQRDLSSRIDGGWKCPRVRRPESRPCSAPTALRPNGRVPAIAAPPRGYRHARLRAVPAARCRTRTRFRRLAGRRARTAGSVSERVDDVVDPELEGFVPLIDRKEARSRHLPILGEIRVVVGDRHEAPARIVLFEEAEVLRR